MVGNSDDSPNRRQVLQSITAGAASLGLMALARADAAGVNGNSGGSGNNSDEDGGSGNNPSGDFGNDDSGNEDSGNDSQRYIVGTKSEKAKDEISGWAQAVRAELNFGSNRQAVAGTFSEETREGLEQRSDVRYIEKDTQMEAFGETLPWGVDRVNADNAHDADVTGAGADIAILDTGIDSDHPDLVGNIGTGKAFINAG